MCWFDSSLGHKKDVDYQRLSHLKKESRPSSRPKAEKNDLKETYLKEFKERLRMTKGIDYKPAQLYSAGNDLSKEWYVYYYYLMPGTDKFQRFKERYDINRLKTVTDRLLFGRELAKFWNEKLQEGYNPFEIAEKKAAVKSGVSTVAMRQQIEQIVNEFCNGETDNAVRNFVQFRNRFYKYIESAEIEKLPLASFTEEHAEGFKAWMIELKFSKKTINETLAYVSRYFKAAEKKKWIGKNYFPDVERVTERNYRVDVGENEDIAERFEPITRAEFVKIFEKLNELQDYDFIAFLSFIYYSWARPAEIKRLRCEDIELNGSTDFIRFRTNNTKNNKYAMVQIVPELRQIIERMKLQNYSGRDYLFGRYTLKPSAQPLGKNSPGERWQRIVKQGLGINKDMYALKHTGNIDYLQSNKGKVDLKWQQMQNRHKTSAMTDRYNRKLGAYFIEVGNVKFAGTMLADA
jgi:integrase